MMDGMTNRSSNICRAGKMARQISQPEALIHKG